MSDIILEKYFRKLSQFLIENFLIVKFAWNKNFMNIHNYN